MICQSKKANVAPWYANLDRSKTYTFILSNLNTTIQFKYYINIYLYPASKPCRYRILYTMLKYSRILIDKRDYKKSNL